eukprot:TRINITY_DN12761_c0_g1_i1.p2 TRINITY_DN12761_c0_g1~~TRINITY_DN12761_c0_g1_i1.p2  ORF type:complete len:163 (+),score=42.11 TRINITY_DN12761_c0_g1_i1:694-1182(+)
MEWIPSSPTLPILAGPSSTSPSEETEPILAGPSSTSPSEETEPRKTTRKRKRKENLTVTSPVSTLASQSRSLKPGLGASKPLKKKARNESAKSDPDKSEPARKEPANEDAMENPKRVEKPKPLKCKKKSGTCRHRIVFNDHHDSKAWKVYADYVKSQKSYNP